MRTDEILPKHLHPDVTYFLMDGFARIRPEMYLGSRGSSGLYALLEIVLNNSIDQVTLGNCTQITVTLHADRAVTVQDNGSGIPILMYFPYWVSFLELVFTRVAGKYQAYRNEFVTTMFGIGLPVLNFLSEKLRVTVARDGFVWQQDYHTGFIYTPLRQIRLMIPGESTGTTITFKPDFSILEPNEFDSTIIEEKLHDLVFLNEGLTTLFRDERTNSIREVEFHAENGLIGYVNELRKDNLPVHRAIHFKGNVVVNDISQKENPIDIEFVAQYMTGSFFIEESFASHRKLRKGQAHIYWLKMAFLNFMNDYAFRKQILIAGDAPFTRKEVTAGLIVVVNISHVNVNRFKQDYRYELPHSELPHVLQKLAADTLKTFEVQHPDQMFAIANWLVSRRYEQI